MSCCCQCQYLPIAITHCQVRMKSAFCQLHFHTPIVQSEYPYGNTFLVFYVYDCETLQAGNSSRSSGNTCILSNYPGRYSQLWAYVRNVCQTVNLRFVLLFPHSVQQLETEHKHTDIPSQPSILLIMQTEQQHHADKLIKGAVYLLMASYSLRRKISLKLL